MKKKILKEFNNHIKVSQMLPNLASEVESAAKLCIECLRQNGKILLFGNGGSAADAQHIAAELVGRYKTDRKGLSAIALTTDTSSITSIGNDFGYNQLFSRQVEALSSQGDVVIGISTSGESMNVKNGLKTALELNCSTIGLSGQGGGSLDKFCNLNIVIPSDETPRIQEMHIVVGHTICELIDQEFKPT